MTSFRDADDVFLLQEDAPLALWVPLQKEVAQQEQVRVCVRVVCVQLRGVCSCGCGVC